MKTLLTFLISFVSLCAFSQHSIKLEHSSNAGVFHNRVFNEITSTINGYPGLGCIKHRRYFKASGDSFNGKTYDNFLLEWHTTNSRWELYGLAYSGTFSIDILGYFAGSSTLRAPECGSVVTPGSGISFGGTLTVVNNSGSGCAVLPCTSPTASPVLSRTTLDTCTYKIVNITATCSVGDAKWYLCPTGNCTGDPASTSGFCMENTGNLSKSFSSQGTYKYKVACQNECGSSAYSEVTVNITSADNPILSNNVTTKGCSGQTVSLNPAGVCSSSQVKWYKNNVLMATLSSSATYAATVGSYQETYKVACFNDPCESAQSYYGYIVEPYDVGDITIVSNPIATCNGGNVTLTASCPAAGITPKWYNAYSGGTLLYTGTTYSTTQTTTKTYYVECNDGSSCSIYDRYYTTVTNVVSGVPTADDVTIACGTTGTTSLTGYGCASSWYYRWYDVPTGGASLSSSQTYSYIPIPSSAKTYYVECLNGTCVSSPRIPVQIIVEGTTAPTGISNVQVCSGSSADLYATCPAGQTTKWYDAAAGGTLLYTGSPYMLASVSTTATYYPACNDPTCGDSERSTSTVTVISPNLLDVNVASGTTICTGSMVTLHATCESGPGILPRFYASNAATTYLDETEYFYSPVLYSTTTYYVACEGNECTNSEGNRTPVVITVSGSAPSVPTNVVAESRNCIETGDYNYLTEQAIRMISASCPVGSEVYWYSNHDDFSVNYPYGIGDKVIILASNFTDLYVACVNASGCRSNYVLVELDYHDESFSINIINESNGSKSFTAGGCGSYPVSWEIGKIESTPRGGYNGHNWYWEGDFPYNYAKVLDQTKYFENIPGNTLSNIKLNNEMYYVAYKCHDFTCHLVVTTCHESVTGNITRNITQDFTEGYIIESGYKNSTRKQVLKANNSINTTAKVVYDAPSITLEPGFEANGQTNSVFIAKPSIGGCIENYFND